MSCAPVNPTCVKPFWPGEPLERPSIPGAACVYVPEDDPDAICLFCKVSKREARHLALVLYAVVLVR